MVLQGIDLLPEGFHFFQGCFRVKESIHSKNAETQIVMNDWCLLSLGGHLQKPIAASVAGTRLGKGLNLYCDHP
ncbi:hypothetical protein Y1Q_0009138 [Alligator mississippiensis]|uniref:Uncharacterized protein n=1 Tax=Alligator mississippiensis TaxID=8496 RepID=A0A151M2D5_ALLMI|nr:hypothetical protein Y1Q_0009138 [Alligator mississippiensis]